jgi:hypothetical protein
VHNRQYIFVFGRFSAAYFHRRALALAVSPEPALFNLFNSPSNAYVQIIDITWWMMLGHDCLIFRDSQATFLNYEQQLW